MAFDVTSPYQIAQDPNGVQYFVQGNTFYNTSTVQPVPIAISNYKIVSSSIQSPVSTSANNLAARRAQNIANFLAGGAIAAPAWVTLTAYVQGQCVTIPTGQVLQCTVAGTSGGSAPVYSPTILTGRPLVDATVTWYGPYQLNGAASAQTNPVVTLYASAAAAGLTETRTFNGTVVDARMTSFDGLLSGLAFQNCASTYVYAAGTAAYAGNATSSATGMGQSAAYSYNSGTADIEFYVTDSVVGLVFNAAVGQIPVDIDGVCLQAGPSIGNNTSGQCWVADFNGIVKRRLVRVANGLANQGPGLRGIAGTTALVIEKTDSPNDTMIVVGDSFFNTLSLSGATYTGIGQVGPLLKRYLGLSGLVNCGQPSTGYVSFASPGQYTTPQLLQSPQNALMFTGYAPGHILICSGFNDVVTNSNPTATVVAAAFVSWQAARAMLPNAKITITDGFAGATGPNANVLALSAGLLAQFNAWGDPNSRFIQTSASAATAWLQGVGNAGIAIAAGNNSVMTGADAVHPTMQGARYLALRLSNAIKSAWNNLY